MLQCGHLLFDNICRFLITYVGSWDEGRWDTYKGAFEHDLLGDRLERFFRVITSFMNDTGSAQNMLSSDDCLAPALIWEWQKQQQSQHNIRFVRLMASDLSQLSEVAHTLQQYPRVKFVLYCDSVIAINAATAHSVMRSTLKGEQQFVHVHLCLAVLYMRNSCLCAGCLHFNASNTHISDFSATAGNTSAGLHLVCLHFHLRLPVISPGQSV